MDYYYTLQGWLKGVNQAYEDDPDIINVADYMAGKDVFAFNLGYFNGDYTPANALLTPTEVRDQLWQRYTEMNSDNGLYNGNIAFMTTDLAKVGHENNDRTKGMQAMLYRYDQLNRIINARSLTNYQAGTGFQTRSSTPAAYDTDYSYDANGNLLTLQRYDESGILQDDFTYSYYEGTNRLMQYLPMNMENKVYNGAVTSNDILYHHITVTGNSYIPTGQDVVLRATGSITISPTFTTSGGNSFKAKLEPDSLSMYQYDAIGNLIRDQYEGVNISWTPYGKVRQVRSRSDSLVVSFTYDAAGNRIAKQVVTQGAELTTVVTRYLRDASGNVLAIYEDSLMIEQPIYGSSRLGMYTGGKIAAHRNMGTKRYELSNHLGNVMTVITDNIGMEQDSVWASVVSTSDYYPFGLGMGGRSFSDSTYRYGFNGKEKDSDGEFGLTHYDYGFRIYNPALGKFLSVDPLTREFPEWTPYQFAGNNPIWAIDLDGAEPLRKTTSEPKEEPTFKFTNVEKVLKTQKQIENAIHSTISSLDLNINLDDPKIYDKVYRTVREHTVIIPQEGITFVLPRNEETIMISESIKKHGPTVLDKGQFFLEGFDKFKPGKVNSKLLKGANLVNKVLNPVNILKVNPLADAIISTVEPLSLGTLDDPRNAAEVVTKEALNKLFTPKPSLDIKAVILEKQTIKSDATDIEKREGNKVPSFKK